MESKMFIEQIFIPACIYNVDGSGKVPSVLFSNIIRSYKEYYPEISDKFIIIQIRIFNYYYISDI